MAERLPRAKLPGPHPPSSHESLSSALILILGVALAYLAAHLVFDWLARRFLIVSGAEYLILGVLLGPQVSGVLSADVMEGFAPLITLALGWIGAIVGTQFYLPGLIRISGLSYRLGFIEALATGFLVAGATTYAITGLYDVPLGTAWIPGTALGAIAAVSAPVGIEVASRRLGRRGPIVKQLQVSTAVDALVGIVAMGLLLCVRHPAETAKAGTMSATEWAVMTVGIGVVGGALFHLFLGRERATDRLFISLAGAIIVVSGAAAYLHLSPVLATAIMGAILINTSAQRAEITQTLAASERPFYFALLVFAGASWEPARLHIGALWVVLAFLFARVIGKVGSARLGARLNDMLGEVGPDWGRGLIGQGGLALALALSYARQESAQLSNVVFTAAITSVLLTDVLSARVILSVMVKVLPEPVRRHVIEATDIGAVDGAAESDDGSAATAASGTADAPGAVGSSGAARARER